MASDWPTRRIGQVGKVITGKTPPTSDPEHYGGSYPFITIPDLNQGPFVLRSARTLSEAGTKIVRSSMLPPGAVLMSCIATVGRCGITTRVSFTNQQINAVIPNELIDPLFLYYAFTQLGPSLAAAGAGGSVYANVSKGRFEKIEISIPECRREQARIAQYLGRLDGRIALLRDTNGTLETIAQALFKSWFVDFDPVRAKAEGREPEGMDAATFALFPSEFEDSELGPIPKGWHTGKLVDVAKLRGGKQLSRDLFAEDGKFPIYGGAGEMGRTNIFNAEGSVVTVGRVGAYCGQFFLHNGAAWVNNNASRVIPHSKYLASTLWIFLALKNSDIDRIKKGAAQPFVSNSDIEGLPLVIPGDACVDAFTRVASPIFERASRVREHIQRLTELRDTLLPRLISGRLRLSEVEGEEVPA